MSDVFFFRANRLSDRGKYLSKIETLFQAAGLSRVFHKGDFTALKLHVGEPGCVTAVPPDVVKGVVRCLDEVGVQPFLTDSAVLYRSPRDNGVGHARIAQRHGYSLGKVGAPFIPADGLIGDDEIKLPVNGKHYQEVSMASAIVHAQSMLVLSHPTGHLGAGFGGAIKNLGMGCCSKKAKLSQHSDQLPKIRAKKCTACGECALWCPVKAIQVGEAAQIDPKACIGCGECIAICRAGAVSFEWSMSSALLQERIVEHAAAMVHSKPNRIAYINVAISITKDCDCIGRPQHAVTEDLGFFASFDPVAIDAAVTSAIRAQSGMRLEDLSYPETDSSIQLTYGEKMGMGTTQFNLIDVS